VEEPRDLAVAVEVSSSLFEAANAEHAAVELKQLVEFQLRSLPVT
jgi:hypothetical protein